MGCINKALLVLGLLFLLGLACAVFEPMVSTKWHCWQMKRHSPLNHAGNCSPTPYPSLGEVLTDSFTVKDAYQHFGSPTIHRYIDGKDIFIYKLSRAGAPTPLQSDSVTSFLLVFQEYTLVEWWPLAVGGISIRTETEAWTSAGNGLHAWEKWPGVRFPEKTGRKGSTQNAR